MEAVYELFGGRNDLSQVLLLGTLIISRILPIVFITPFLGGRMVPPETKMGISVGLSLLVYVYATGHMEAPIGILNPIVYLALMLKEIFLGLTIGFVAVELFYAMEISGRALDIMRGSNMAEVQVPELAFRASPIGSMMFHLLIVVFYALAGYHIFLDGLFESYRLVPIDSFPTMSQGFAAVINQVLHFTANIFPIAFALVFPGLFATFMTDVVFGMLNRVAPQLNAYFMSMAVKPLLGILFLFFSFGLMLEQLEDHAQDAMIFVERLIYMFD